MGVADTHTEKMEKKKKSAFVSSATGLIYRMSSYYIHLLQTVTISLTRQSIYRGIHFPRAVASTSLLAGLDI